MAKERKTPRTTIAIPPTLKEEIKEIAEKYNISIMSASIELIEKGIEVLEEEENEE